MAVKESRYIRVEDWNGNVYYPDFAKNGSGNGFIIDSTDVALDPSSPPFTEGTHTDDPVANNHSCIVIGSGGARKKMVVANVSGLPFGNVSINLRVKSSLPESILEILEVNTYYVDISSRSPQLKLLDTEKFTAGDFEPGKYKNMSVLTNYNGVDTGETMLQIEVIVLPSTGATFSFDMMAVSMEMASQTETHRVDVEDDTVIVTQKNKIDVDRNNNTLIIP